MKGLLGKLLDYFLYYSFVLYMRSIGNERYRDKRGRYIGVERDEEVMTEIEGERGRYIGVERWRGNDIEIEGEMEQEIWSYEDIS